MKRKKKPCSLPFGFLLISFQIRFMRPERIVGGRHPGLISLVPCLLCMTLPSSVGSSDLVTGVCGHEGRGQVD